MLAAVFLCLAINAAPIPELCDGYLDTYLKTFPTRATELGCHDYDDELFAPARLTEWIKFNQEVHAQITALLAEPQISLDDRLAGEALLAQTERELNEHETLKRADYDPTFWSAIVGNATVFLLVRDDWPLAERQQHAVARVQKLPALAQHVREIFSKADKSKVAPDFCRIAANQLRGASKFYREGFSQAAGGNAASAAKKAADALAETAAVLESLEKSANGSPRLGKLYETNFRVVNRVQEPVSEILSRALDDLARKRDEAARFGRQVWPQLIPNETPPTDNGALLRRLFDRIAADRDQTIDDYETRWRENVRAIESFVREKKIITLPDPLTLVVERSPAFFVGQSVGGVYPAGPYSPDSKTILFLPMPSPEASDAQREAFFRDFNQHFNKMIVPHELIPGHYVQLKIAAHQPNKIRAVFPDPLYVEGWGTFCERLLLDEGWGGPMERLAHLKKQLENIARTIADIRVHTQGLSREELVRFVKNDALQDNQFANNMWTRTITTSPQITTYYLGYTKLRAIYDEARNKPNFQLQAFMDGMMRLGPVSLDHYRDRNNQLP